MDARKFKSGALPLSLLRDMYFSGSLRPGVAGGRMMRFSSTPTSWISTIVKIIDLGRFSKGAYIMPGKYSMTVVVNKQSLDEQPVAFYPPENDPDGSAACVSPELVENWALKPSFSSSCAGGITSSAWI